MSSDESLLCARCNRELQPGRGDFFEVRILAVADPYPPILEAREPAELRRDIARTVKDLCEVSSREATEEVALQRIIHLCNRCFKQWIEAPAG